MATHARALGQLNKLINPARERSHIRPPALDSTSDCLA